MQKIKMPKISTSTAMTTIIAISAIAAVFTSESYFAIPLWLKLSVGTIAVIAVLIKQSQTEKASAKEQEVLKQLLSQSNNSVTELKAEATASRDTIAKLSARIENFSEDMQSIRETKDPVEKDKLIEAVENKYNLSVEKFAKNLPMEVENHKIRTSQRTLKELEGFDKVERIFEELKHQTEICKNTFSSKTRFAIDLETTAFSPIELKKDFKTIYDFITLNYESSIVTVSLNASFKDEFRFQIEFKSRLEQTSCLLVFYADENTFNLRCSDAPPIILAIIEKQPTNPKYRPLNEIESVIYELVDGCFKWLILENHK